MLIFYRIRCLSLRRMTIQSPLTINRHNNRYIHVSSLSNDKVSYEQFRSGSKYFDDILEERKKRFSELDHFKDGIKAMGDEFKLYIKETKFKYDLSATLDTYEDKEIVKLWDFSKENDRNNWRTSCDSDWGTGNTTCDWTVSNTGRGIFTGNLDITTPKDGRVKHSGYAFVGCEKARKSFYRSATLDWGDLTHLVIRVRGDGRTWNIVLNTSGFVDVTWAHRYVFPLYTHGGPYWQWSRIPFNKFFFIAKQRVQDMQSMVPLEMVNQLGFRLSDRQSGPFRLEIDYVGVMRDDDFNNEFAYETYYIPEALYPDTV